MSDLDYGTCSDVELIARVISDGRGGKDAVRKAGRLLDGYRSTRLVVAAADTPGQPLGHMLNPTQRRRLSYAKELARRFLAQRIAEPDMLSTPQDVARWAGRLAFACEEVLTLVGLDAANRIVAHWEIARGWEGGINIHPRQIFSLLVRESIGRFLLIHNHPSGRQTPSREDITFTRMIIEAGRLLGIDLLDHVVVAADGYFSMRAGCDDLEFGRCSG